ncbi:SNF1-interacting protein [Cadophora gregata]|uniref:SNF1-interacting protein n=1 Tax=Cadophora gregata TaxID=51156 RepID=UPI0026DB266A|nr:SNF1-interacting protein [Cadophora gregata]KAK0113136.1 SNF1-interacting protein [Cadophora gregata]KAK0125177.1 SNF1-interacting protein [Cadophora gregata f. sp. sojae]
MSESVTQPLIPHIAKPLSLIPVGLKEASLDSPSYRATAVHFSDQVEIIEKWLDAYVKSISKLVHDVSSLEETFNAFLLRSVPPANVSEAVLDHDYTLLAMKRFGEGSREWWSQVISGMKKMDTNIVEPIKSFMAGELRNFKDARRYLEQSQKTFDNTLARYVSQSKTKEPSSLREDAFQVHETRKAYLKASLDFCLLAPQLRYTIDKLLIRVSSDQWREMRRSRDSSGASFAKWGVEMDRVRGWSREMEAGEGIFRRELQIARREIAEAASQASKPSRELDDYNLSTVSTLGVKGPSAVNLSQGRDGERSGKQGWLFLKGISGKPARTTWVRRWFYVKNGIFGWLVQGIQSGGVEEGEKIGVLLCNVKPAVQEERRFCFDVKTKNQTITVQAETQGQLMDWLESFEVAKNKALEASANDNYSHPGGIDPAFAITPPSIPEFAAKTMDGHMAHGSDELGINFDRVGTLPVPGPELGILAPRSSFDVSAPRRSVTTREDGESSRDHAARIMSKLDLHRKTTIVQADPPPAPSPASGGIASLISASHNILPVYSTPAITQLGPNAPTKPPPIFPPLNTEPQTASTLAPSTLANPPAPTNLSKSAVIVSGERGIGVGRSDATGGMPSGIMANLWGSSNWGYINRLEKGEIKSQGPNTSVHPSPSIKLLEPAARIGDENRKPEMGLSHVPPAVNSSTEAIGIPALPTAHRKAISVDIESTRMQGHFAPKPEVFPVNYPLELRTQEAQFRMLFPNVSRDDKVLLVFRAAWNPNEQQEFPGRVYVTQHDIYFYSHHLGLVLISGVSMDSITEVTAAPGRDCDFIFLHLREDASSVGYTRITIKTFLEPLRLLQSRLNYLIDISQSREPLNLQSTIDALVKMENVDPTRSPSMESWEDVSVNTPIDDGTLTGRRKDRDLRATIHVERGLHLGRANKEVTKFQLPSQPIVYEPQNMQRKAVERIFDISPKALFHVIFGDKSTIFQVIYHDRRAQRIAQGPWISIEENHLRRDFHFQIDYVDVFRRARQANIVDYQVIDVINDHVCYVVTDRKTPWHLPHHKDFMLVSKIVITHVAKSRSKLAIYTKVDWSKAPTFSKGLVERQALDDSGLDADDLVDVIADQVRKLGPHSRTKKAVNIFGHIGLQTSVSLFSAKDSGHSKRPQIKQRTLTNMLLETVGSFGESAISSVMMWTFAAIRTLWKIASAHSIILTALLLSILANAFFTSRDTSEWWSERNAAKFMTRIGVGPNPIMGKSIFLKDIDDALTVSYVKQTASKCYAQFRDIANVTDLGSQYEAAGALFSRRATQSTAQRLRRARQHLGSYRHELMIAIRVVNNVEREMVKAEWENWLLNENQSCRQVQVMLQDDRRRKPTTQGESQQTTGIREQERRADELRRWQEEYCGSCRFEQEMLLQERRDFTSR